MASKYWIKLYHEILYDRKLASLDDHLWRRILECFLMAGEQNEVGYLPPLEDMAWTLRSDAEQLETDLNGLVRIGILELKDERYFVLKFATRQEPMAKAEYMRRKREEAQSREHYKSLPERDQLVTGSNHNEKSEGETYKNLPKPEVVTRGNTESDTDKETDKKRKEEIDKIGGAGFYILDLVGLDYNDADDKLRAQISQMITKYGEYVLCDLASQVHADYPELGLGVLSKIDDYSLYYTPEKSKEAELDY